MDLCLIERPPESSRYSASGSACCIVLPVFFRGQVECKRPSALALSRSVRHRCPLSLLLYILELGLLLPRLMVRACSQALHGINVPGGTQYFAYTDDVSNFVSCWSDTELVQKAFERSENAMINRNKSSGFRLDPWKGVSLPGSFSWSEVQIFSLSKMVEGTCKVRSVGPDLFPKADVLKS